MNSRFNTLFSTIIFLFIGINFCNSQDYINYYSEHSSNSFLNEIRLTESVNGEQINIDLLNATIFYLTNIERRKKELIAFDFVSNPSTKGAFMFPSGEQSLQEGIVKNPLTNKWEKVEDLIRDILGEIK